MRILEKLALLRDQGGKIRTAGLPDAVIERFAALSPELVLAVDEAVIRQRTLASEFPELMGVDEEVQAAAILEKFVNFYADDAVNPYVALAARGPWIITTRGAVIHDSGGYGMLGFGHGPEAIMQAMSGNQVMANIMTPSFSQLRLARALQKEIGHTRSDGCPYTHFLCLNSGSESVTCAARLSDVNAREMTDPGGPHAGKAIVGLAMRGGFHGRTERPAQFSDSTQRTYARHLATFRDLDNLMVIEPNNIEQLESAFERADRENLFIESLFLEPVMGEGNPGYALDPAFFKRARELTLEHGALLLVDSIQAGLRAHGVLSVVDYPGFEGCAPPDMETYSKALNAGQYPLSVLAVTERAAALYRKGIYGNTMTANPRALDVAVAVLRSLTDDVRANIRDRGTEFLDKLGALAAELDGRITAVQGTGLLLSCELDPAYKCFGSDSIEEYMRFNGIGVVHGGINSLRFTPYFAITSPEIDLIVESTRDALLNGPQARTDTQQRRASS